MCYEAVPAVDGGGGKYVTFGDANSGATHSDSNLHAATPARYRANYEANLNLAFFTVFQVHSYARVPIPTAQVSWWWLTSVRGDAMSDMERTFLACLPKESARYNQVVEVMLNCWEKQFVSSGKAAHLCIANNFASTVTPSTVATDSIVTVMQSERAANVVGGNYTCVHVADGMQYTAPGSQLRVQYLALYQITTSLISLKMMEATRNLLAPRSLPSELRWEPSRLATCVGVEIELVRRLSIAVQWVTGMRTERHAMRWVIGMSREQPAMEGPLRRGRTAKCRRASGKRRSSLGVPGFRRHPCCSIRVEGSAEPTCRGRKESGGSGTCKCDCF